VGTLDGFDEALKVIGRQPIDLILSDVRLRSQETGIDLARAAKEKGIPTLFATGHEYPQASEVAIGYLMKPYNERQLKGAIDSVERLLTGGKVKPQKGLTLFSPETGAPV
jgi:two-component SAPR family response regulator